MSSVHMQLSEIEIEEPSGECSATLVTMTRIKKTSRRGQWSLQDAKARFSEVVRRAKTDGPQRVTLHGREEVVILSVEEYRRVKGVGTGQALVDLLRSSPLEDLDLERVRFRGPVRSVEL